MERRRCALHRFKLGSRRPVVGRASLAVARVETCRAANAVPGVPDTFRTDHSLPAKGRAVTNQGKPRFRSSQRFFPPCHCRLNAGNPGNFRGG